MRPLIKKLQENFATVLEPGNEVRINKTMVPWHGQLSSRRYIPGKAHKYGVKLFKTCTKEGYTLNVDIYAVKSDRQVGVELAEDMFETHAKL